MESIGDAWSFSGNTPITLSRGFSVETLTGVTPLWKTELNKSISAMEDGIPRWLQHYHKTCCEKDGHCERQACMFWRCLHYGDVVSRQVDLHITVNLSFNFLNAFSYFSIHFYFWSFFTILYNGLAITVKYLMNQ